MTTKSRAKCTAIRRIIVPQALVNAVSDAWLRDYRKVVVGDPAQEGENGRTGKMLSSVPMCRKK